jgi:hypothetical protein
MVHLIHYLTNEQLPLDFGVGISTFYDYSNVPKLWKWNSCYFDGLKKGPRGGEMKPQSLIERRFIGKFSNLAGVNDSYLGKKLSLIEITEK